MSTRANIIVKDQYGELIFYRHSDGYPKGAMPTLEKFLQYVKENRIRDNVEQAAGWLIILGREEYREAYKNESWANTKFDGEPSKPSHARNDGYGGNDWKVGAIEPATCIHGDIEYLYVIDLDKKTIRHCEAGMDGDYNASIPTKFYSGKFNQKVAA
jgi:hypothetical protein